VAALHVEQKSGAVGASVRVPRAVSGLAHCPRVTVSPAVETHCSKSAPYTLAAHVQSGAPEDGFATDW
jgi:hypothetical protein